jgi:hypothetical protein
MTTENGKSGSHVCRAAGFAGRAAGLFLGTAVLLTLLLFAAYALPGEPVRQNVEQSVPLLQREGLYPEYFGCKLFQMDNYTDTVMLFEAASADETAPLTAMMTNTAYNVDNFETLPADLQTYLAARSAGQTGVETGLRPFSYARYWHGYLAYLRPLLLLLDYGQVRIVNAAVLMGLLAALLILLRRRAGWKTALWFAASQALVTVWWVPRQMQFFTCFLLAYLGCLWVLAKPRSASALALGMLVCGMCTSFFDLLVTPILTLGLPLAVWLVCRAGSEKQGAQGCGAVAGAGVLWAVGYGGCWGTKWLLAGWVTGSDVIADALRQAGVRTAGDTWHGMELTWTNLFRFVYESLNSRGLFWPMLVVLALLVLLFCLCLNGKAAFGALPMALTALTAPVWLCVLREHSVQHGWFTWRALCVTVFAGGVFVARSCDFKAAARRLRLR